MSHDCTLDCGIEADTSFVELYADKLICGEPDTPFEVSHLCGEYPLGGDFNGFGYDLVVDQDLEVNQRTVVPAGRTWRVFGAVVDPGGLLIVNGTIITG